MKTKRILSMCLAVCILFTLTGCQLAKEDAGETNNGDRLIGVFVTKKYLDLFDMEGYLNDNISKLSGGGEIILDGNDSKYQGRLYATLKTRTLTEEKTGEIMNTKEFIFDNVDGSSYFAAKIPATEDEDSYITSGSGEGISDRHSAYNYGDEENSTTLEGTIYLSPSYAGNTCYINPVFQSVDGSVYATAEHGGFMVDGMIGEGAVYTTTLNETKTITENGKSKVASFSIKISLVVMLAPEKIAIMQMNHDSVIVSRNEYSPGELPDTLNMEMATAYLIVETYKHDLGGNLVVTRSTYDRNNESIDTFYCRDDGICVKKWTQLNWSKSNFIH
ncbi:hypothetical protein [Lachnoclostridium phytofermentans]|uniref:Lipoprotein n=1 Tax=Lachnoclostridium phytofermentans (strain ATCC 700394 / DSM 18823 / ISDg) TaxID=357809 RepID=A9KT18_LACP7|nr:hypothetical protein [Lachnoclostridium phytofermentans]ABX42229.1 conserved hypothetical protein [Lachnoclostridium phytofermentans ISDg]